MTFYLPVFLLLDGEKFSAIDKSISVNKEYLNALRTQSYVELTTKAQLLANEHSDTPKSNNYAMETLLKPDQDAIPSLLEAPIFTKAQSDLKLLISSYFETSAEASRICGHLLRSINETHSHYQRIQRILKNFSDHSPAGMKSTISELDSFALLSNPFPNPSQQDFKLIHDQYSSILHHLKLKRSKVARRIKLIECIKKVSGISLTVVCGVVGLVAIVIAVHSLSGFLMGPALMGLSPLHLKKKFSNLKYFQSKFLRKLDDQLDAAAKGTYILNRDFDTMSQLVASLYNEVEHYKAMIRFCLERREDKFPLQEVMKELKRRSQVFKQQVEELQEHVCLCLVTINRARVLVIKEISAA
ncbi:UPF0496 protein At1g20180-like [Phoenix dactylifera]|uniref:UPF0496 protein At1g20180-like n=1 Tax=Phoenix dactylifera TaxID=42345 RepID=A0A8B7BML6_PHODC|nr:UPF0496 protein At1g20180-like [Phoenix dactylifera]